MYAMQEQYASKQLIGNSRVFMEEMKKIPLIARCNSSVLISGETGTGKEVCAQTIHYLSPRSGGSFVPVNCGAIPVELAENELFGHKRGAFTGAATSNVGLISEAEAGTLFLDEVDSLPHLVQVKLLRFLQEKTYRPLGSPKECQADVRVLAATSMDSEEAVRSGRLRRDLYYRLNVISIKLPPLRDRRDDIALLAHYFLKKYAVELGKPASELSPRTIEKLLLHDWPGNVRELEHVIERAVVFSDRAVIRECDICVASRSSHGSCLESFKDAKERFVRQFEESYLQKLLLIYQGNISKAARAAQKNRRAFWELIRKHQIDVASYKTQ